MDSECPSCRYTISADYLNTISAEYLRQSEEIADSAVKAGDETSAMCPNCGASIASLIDPTVSIQVRELPTSRRFARFELLRVLGRGGFGTVWLANDSQLDRKVALKLPTGKRGEMANLIREAKTAAKLHHPNIVTVHEVGEIDNQVFIVCEYVEGMDLRVLLQKEAMPESRAVELLQAIASGLHHAHENSVVHRDMKPANILVDNSGTPLVADFGLAKNIDVEESISSKGRIVGTILYMAPEQAGDRPDEIDRRADIYALGVMMYEMLTGERPFRGDVQAIIHQKTREEIVPLRRLRPKIPLDLETICLKCLQASPARRYETALAFQEELDRYREGLPIHARPVSKLEHAWRWCRRNRAIASLLTLLFLTLSTGLASTTFFWLQARAQTAKIQRSLYASQMILASSHLDDGDIGAARQALNRFLAPEIEHLRGFEWYFLSRNLQRFQNTLQHGKQIIDIGMSREGDWIASIADDRAMRIWNATSGSQMREIPAKIGRWQALAVSRRDNQLAAGAKDGTVYIWNSVHDQSVPPKVLKHGPGVQIVKYSADGTRLFSAADKGAIRVWDTATHELLEEIPSGQEGVVDLDVSRDGSIIVVAGGEGTLRAWEVDTRSMICMVREERHRIEAVAVAPDGQRFYAGSYGSYLLGYRIDGENLFARNTRYDWITDIEFLAASPVIAICSSKGAVAFFDVEKRQELCWIETHNGAGGVITVSSNGKSMAAGSKTGTINLLDTVDYNEATVMRFEEHARDVDIFTERIVIAAFGDGSVKRLDFGQQSTQILKEPTGLAVAAICVLPELALCAVAQENGSVDLFNAAGERIDTIPERTAAPKGLRLAACGSLLVVAERSGTIFVYELDRSRKPMATEVFNIDTESEANIRDVCVSDDARTIAVAIENSNVRLFDIPHRKWRPQILSFESNPVSVAYADQDLLVGTRDGFISRLDAQSLSSIWRIKAHAGHLNMISVIPHSDAVASVGRDKDLHIWDLVNGDLRGKLFRHEHQIFAVDSTTDGRTLVTGGLEGDVRLWKSEEKKD